MYKLELAVGGRRQEPNQQTIQSRLCLQARASSFRDSPTTPYDPACCTTGHAPSLSPLSNTQTESPRSWRVPNRQGRLLSQMA